VKVAREWIRKNAADVPAYPPAIMEGPVIVKIG
jgi:hypothetical protein